MNSAELEPVSRTAVGVVAARAAESARPDRLFEDPFAQVFVDAMGVAPRLPTPALQLHVAVRTRYYDDYLLASGCRQVVLLGAGLDPRAYRLHWPAGTSLFELDLPPVLALKEGLLARAGSPSRCDRRTVGVDLRDAWDGPLVAAGFDPAEPTAWLAEGLLVYLDASATEHVLTTVGRLSAVGSRLACEGPRGQGASVQAAGEVAQLWRGGLGTDLPEWLRAHGWVVGITSLADLAREYGRGGADAATSTFVSARR